ncbi:MAG: hypothetical protein C0597_11005 [Marinilabiliales bacterium]|nr:MAG: hypothetical protein C0597_11005 [Marinilabiliales bacterium]
MKKNIVSLILGSMIILFALQSCEDENENETKISSYNSSESHNTGQDCMSCHKEGGSGEGVFTVAGTVYQSNQTTTYPEATVKLYSEANGTETLFASIEVDQRGNFYTTQQIAFGDGLYARVDGSSGTKYMVSSLTTGACSSCHGNSTDPIWVE